MSEGGAVMKKGDKVRVTGCYGTFEDHTGREGVVAAKWGDGWLVILDGEFDTLWFFPDELTIIEEVAP